MAAPITITIPHKLGNAEAKSRVHASVNRFKDQMAGAGLGQMNHDWSEDRLAFHAKALGQSINGRIDVRESDLQIEIELPALLGGLAGKIAGKLRKEGPRLLTKK